MLLLEAMVRGVFLELEMSVLHARVAPQIALVEGSGPYYLDTSGYMNGSTPSSRVVANVSHVLPFWPPLQEPYL
jgi:hypothetical protein